MSDNVSEGAGHDRLDYGEEWDLLWCTNCLEDVHPYRHPKGGTVLACDCRFIDRDDLHELDEQLPEESDCKGPVANADQELLCHPWRFGNGS